MDDHKGLQWAQAAWTRAFRPWRRFLLRQRPPRRYPPGHWAKWLNVALSRVATAALILLMAYRLAGITWTLMPGERMDAPPPFINPGTPPQHPASPLPDIEAIAGAHLFGEYVEPAAVPAPPVLQAPDTELDLLLKATLSEAREERFGAAVIAGAGVERTYTAGEEIEGANGAVLHAIHSDRVILDIAGQFQTLRLPRSGAADHALALVTAASGPALTNPFAPVRPAPVSATSTAPGGLAPRLRAAVRAVPHVEQGAVLGFRLDPGDDAATFAALGFEPSDVVTDINGTALRDPRQANEVFERLGESPQANVTLLRDGAPRVLTVDTSVLEASGTAP